MTGLFFWTYLSKLEKKYKSAAGLTPVNLQLTSPLFAREG